MTSKVSPLTKSMSSLPYIVLLLKICSAIWPPPFKISLSHQEVFAFGDESDYNDEMIKEDDLKTLKLFNDTNLYNRLHKHVKRYDKNASVVRNITNKFWNETNFDLIEPIPWYGSYLDSNVKRRYYPNNDSSDKSNDSDINYDYEALKKEYEDQLLGVELKSNETYNYTDVKENESVKDALDVLVDFNVTNKNCTEEELTGIGYVALKCIINDLKGADGLKRNKLLKILFKIIGIWVGICIGIILLLFLHKGWCCCCCRCKFCDPRQELDECKKFLADNPPGIYYEQKNNQTHKFETNRYELYAYKKLRDKIMNI